MSDIIIRAESLSKRYKIGALKQRHDTLRDQLDRIRISFFENPLFCPSLQGEMMGREGRMRANNRLDLGARTWYRHDFRSVACQRPGERAI